MAEVNTEALDRAVRRFPQTLGVAQRDAIWGLSHVTNKSQCVGFLSPAWVILPAQIVDRIIHEYHLILQKEMSHG